MGRYIEWAEKKNAQINAIINEGAALAQKSNQEPSPMIGLLSNGFPAWEPNRQYKAYELFTYDGKVGFTRQAFTSSEVYPPFSVGVEALYGVRPIPDDDGFYPYVYNMAAVKDMKVKDEGIYFICYNPIDPVLWPPKELPAHFKEIG